VSLQSALINLVRKSFLSASVVNDYTTGSPLLTRHDEIAFVDPHGDPCAIPTEPGIDSIDYEYAYVTGARGHSLRGSLVKIGLNIDYIDNTLKRKLDQWRQERAQVWVSPNMGRNTLFSWRPADTSGANYTATGTAARDLTGNYALTSTFGAFLRYWDTDRRMFLPKTSSNRAQLVHTPGGAGLVAHPTVLNRMVPTYPKSATMNNQATSSGWAIGGAGAANVTAALVTNGFGQTDCPHSLRVTVAAAASGDRYLFAADQFNQASGTGYAGYQFVNATAATATVWLRGQLPDQFALQFGAITGNDLVLRTIGSARLDTWTPYSVSYTPTAWATNPPTLYLICHSATGLACSFEIGPVMVQQDSAYSSMPAAPVWTPQVTGGTASGLAHVVTAAAVTMPGQGTVMLSYFAPADIAGAWRTSATYGMFSNTNIAFRISISGAYEYMRLDSITPTQSMMTASAARGTLMVPGKINTFAFTWDATSQKIYANGELAIERATASTTVPIGGGSTTLTIGGKSSGSYSCAPLSMLTARIDEGAMTAVEIGQLHTALTDPIALSLAKTCSGRTFRITKTPQMLRASNGGSQILGVVELEQVDYDQNTAEPMSVEASIV